MQDFTPFFLLKDNFLNSQVFTGWRVYVSLLISKSTWNCLVKATTGTTGHVFWLLSPSCHVTDLGSVVRLFPWCTVGWKMKQFCVWRKNISARASSLWVSVFPRSPCASATSHTTAINYRLPPARGHPSGLLLSKPVKSASILYTPEFCHQSWG